MNRFILRDEYFGSTLYDKLKLRHVFLDKKDTQKVLDNNFIFNDSKINHFEHLRASTKNIRKDIIYSPIRIYYEITTKCNLRCKTCFNKSSIPNQKELSFDQIKKLLQGLKRDNVFDIRFTGGEIITKERWNEILQYAKDLGFAISMNTNGVYSDESTTDKIASINPDQVTISFDGLEKTHDFIRGKGNFQQSLSSLKKLYKKGVSLRTNTLITKNTINEVEQIIQLIGPYVKTMAFFNMRLIVRDDRMLKKAVNYKELKKFNKHMDIITKKYPTLDIQYREPATTYNSIAKNNKLGLSQGRCPGGLTRFVITSEGDLHTCGYLPYINNGKNIPGANLGNIVNEKYTILNVWNNSKKLETFRGINKKRTSVCLDCKYYQKRECPGACLADEYIARHLHCKNNYCLRNVQL